jgi:hypothetical protein
MKKHAAQKADGRHGVGGIEGGTGGGKALPLGEIVL